MYKHHLQCRACGYGSPGASGTKSPNNERLIPVFDLGVQPLANDFRNETEEHAGHAPLKVMFCPNCTLAQLSVVVRPEILYSNYSYVTSHGKMMMSHLELLWADLIQEYGTGLPSPEVMEIGSNDGTFLHYIRSTGVNRILGIEPAANLVIQAAEKDIPTVHAFFDAATAAQQDPVDIVIARHVFCHMDDWHDFIKGLEIVGHSGTVYAIEVPYVLDMIEHMSFDQIYHEHLSYLSVMAIVELLNPTGLYLDRIIRYPIHGGSIVLVLKKRSGSGTPHESVFEYIKKEEGYGLGTWKNFSNNSLDAMEKLKRFIADAVADGRTVVGYGASAKSTVWINGVGLTRNEIRWICDETPGKQYKFSPGTDIPIVDPGALLRDRPDYAVLFAWNFAPEIIEKEKLYVEKGGKFIVPIPALTVIP